MICIFVTKKNSIKRVYIFQKAFLAEEPTNGVEDVSNEDEADAATEVPVPVENELESCDKPKYKSEFERQLDEIRKQMEAIQQLPSVLLANLSVLQVQLDKIVEAKAANDQNQVDYYLFFFIHHCRITFYIVKFKFKIVYSNITFDYAIHINPRQ